MRHLFEKTKHGLDIISLPGNKIARLAYPIGALANAGFALQGVEQAAEGKVNLGGASGIAGNIFMATTIGYLAYRTRQDQLPTEPEAVEFRSQLEVEALPILDGLPEAA